MKNWYESLDVRERRLIVSASVLLLLLLFYALAWKPVSTEYHRLNVSIKEKEKTLVEMHQLAVQAKQLQRLNVRSSVQPGGSLLANIDRTAKSNGLGPALKRVRPDGENKASVSLEGAEFDRVVVWLENLQRRQGIDVVSVTVEKQKEPGLVSMRIEMQEGSK